MEKPAIKSFNFVKSVSALGIIAFHLCCHLQSREFLPFLLHANSDWGGFLVAIFFIVSGAALYYRYADDWNCKKMGTYFYKRWKSIFPMYYMAYVYFEIQHIFQARSLFFRGNPVNYIYTLFGMDGYLSQTTTTYYTMGEWFTGAIIILYILFPLVLWGFLKNANVTFFITIGLYLLFLDKPIINSTPYWSITSCLVSFTCGMWIMKYREKILNKRCALVAFIGFLVFYFVKLPVGIDVCNHLMGLFGFIFLTFAGEYFMKNKIVEKVFTEISSISYGVFLMHHVAIFNVLGVWNPAAPSKILLLLAVIIVLVLCQAKALTIVTNAFVVKMDDILQALYRKIFVTFFQKK